MRKSIMHTFINRNTMFVLAGMLSLLLINSAFADQESTSHQGKAVVKVINMDKGVIKLAHEPIASLNWPAMTMDFMVEENALLQGVKVNDSVTFTFIQANSNNVITQIQSDKQTRQGY